MATLPKFKTLEEAADFWDSHDFEDYVAETQPVTILVRMPHRTRRLTIPLDLKLYQKIEALAGRRKVAVEKLVSAWLSEKVVESGTL